VGLLVFRVHLELVVPLDQVVLVELQDLVALQVRVDQVDYLVVQDLLGHLD
jgi:hypothetical protein